MPPKPMTLAFVNSTRKWGGVKSWTLDFGQALQERGHRVVVATRGGNPFTDACREVGFSVYPFHFGPKYNPLAICRMVRLFRRERPDVVVVNISKDLEVGAVAAKMLGIPVLHRVGLVEDYRGTWEERLRHRFLVDRVLVPAQWMREALLETYPWIAADEIEAIPNSKRLPAREEVPARAAGGEVVFGTTSQLSNSKGHTHLLRALQGLQLEGPQMRLRIAGQGPLEQRLRTEVRERGLDGCVEFCGFRSDVPAFLRELDVFVLPSEKEGFPNALLEAMVLGIPCAAFAIPGVREMVGEDVDLPAVGDAEALGGLLAGFAEDPDRRAAAGRAARRRAEENFDLAVNVIRLEGLLEALAGR